MLTALVVVTQTSTSFTTTRSGNINAAAQSVRSEKTNVAKSRHISISIMVASQRDFLPESRL